MRNENKEMKLAERNGFLFMRMIKGRRIVGVNFFSGLMPSGLD